MGADYSFYVKPIATFALTFFGYIISVLASVMRVGSLSTDRWVETRLGAKYHDKLPPQTSQLLMADCHAYLYIFRHFFSLSKKFTKIIMCLNTAVYKSGKYLYGLFKMFVLDGIDHQLFCYLHVYTLHFLFRW